MKLKGLGFCFAALVCSLSCSESGFATSSTTYWTPCTTDVQPFGVWHITYDNYFTVGKKRKPGDFPTDVGLTVGLLPYKKLNMEIGFDLLEPTEEPLFFNAKIGTPEGVLFDNAPAFNVGIFNVGTKKGVTDYDIVDFIAGKTLPAKMGRIFAAYYISATNTLKTTATGGDGDNSGFMIAYDKGFYPVKDEQGEYNRFVFAADYASGKNYIGGYGPGLYVYFTRNVSLLTGPVWFNDKKLNGDMKWTIQLDVNFKF